jgi:hypothetical protein
MFRFARVGWVALALLALAGVLPVSPAQAEGPFWKVCAKVAGGEFEDSKCSVKEPLKNSNLRA